MLLVLLLIFQLSTSIANPFHKYPFVFLLDVGNEELEKTNTEQLRVSMPGGSVALRYPAIGDGDTIGHIRVSGIDFGTDLKANIVDGGPGAKYVVLTFMGNPGVAYEAIVTVQTIPNTKSVYNSLQAENQNVINREKSDPYSVQQDNNDSAEETSDSESQFIQKMNAELTQSSSKVYSYAVREENSPNLSEETADDKSNGYEFQEEDYANGEQETEGNSFENEVGKDADENSETAGNGNDIHRPEPEQDVYENVEVEDSGDEKQNEYTQGEKQSGKEDYDEEPIRVDKNLYQMYEALRPHLYDAKVVPIGTYDEQSDPAYREDPSEIDQMFNDEEIHNEGKYYDSNNNNNFDTDDSSAVAY